MKEISNIFNGLNSENVFIVSLMTLFLTAIISITVFYVNESNLMAKNIESAINKGIEPLSVRCSYVRGDDPICLTFAAGRKENQAETTTSKR